MRNKRTGWVVSLWIDTTQVPPNEREELPYLSWSPYDRITIDEANYFSDFFDVKDKESFKWIGTVQRLHLVPMNNTTWKPGLEEENVLINPNNSDGESYGLYSIVTARFQYPFTDISSVEKRLCNVVSKHLAGKNVEWQAFNSLGAEDFVGIFLANTISELAEAYEFLKQITYSDNGARTALFSSVYSFLGLNNPNFDQNPGATLIERLYLKTGYNKKFVFDELKKICPEISYRNSVSGKGCLEIEVSNNANNVLSYFHNTKKSVFNGNSDFYKTYIESSRTYWYVEPFDIIPMDIENVCIPAQCDDSHYDFQGVDIQPISKFILKEYERLIHSHRCLLWKPILVNQYNVYADFVKQYTEDKNDTALCHLNNRVQTVLLHINQATTPIYEVPYHNYYYSGSYNDVLRMYYGIIATIFNIAYSLPHDEKTLQYDITYCVDFEAAKKVHSNMYVNGDRRFVIFHLPYDAFMHFDKTIKYLVHEVFHYIAPFSRPKRNNIFVKVWIITIFEKYIEYLKSNGLSECNSKEVTDYFYNHYEIFCKKIDLEIGDALDNKILNEFTDATMINHIRPVLEKICYIICNIVNIKLGYLLDGLEQYCKYNIFYEYIFSPSNYDYIKESVRRVALAAKESFCDLNMIYLLDMPLTEYLELLFDAFLGEYRDCDPGKMPFTFPSAKGLSIGSFELRIGILLDQYYSTDISTAKFKDYREKFVNDINKATCKSTSQTFKNFCDYLLTTYDSYMITYASERHCFKELFFKEAEWFSSNASPDVFRNKLQEATRNKDNEVIDNINIIRNFMYEEVDKSLIDKNKKDYYFVRYSSFNANWDKGHMTVCNMGEYVKECCDIIQDWQCSSIWFRGVCSENYLLTPSLFRYKHFNYELSLYANQTNILKDAYYMTLSQPTLLDEHNKNTLEHMCLLQHYGLPTNLLDFSEDMLMALHFALNPDNPSDVEKINNYIHQPKVVLFNPFKYRDAVKSLQQETPITPNSNMPPYLLYAANDKQLLEYCIHDMSEDFLRYHSIDYAEWYTPNYVTNKYPMPLAIPWVNDRVFAQKGTFVAFNLYAKPDRSKKKSPKMVFDYLSLERIQENYLHLLNRLNKPTTNECFMKEIYINKLSIPLIKNQLKTMKITTARAYPELFRKFSEYMEG